MITRVKLMHATKGADGKYLSYSNIIWRPSFPMYGGEWPKGHPCRDNPNATVWPGDKISPSDDALGKLRAKGYFASCFPEGDGIAFHEPDGVPVEQIIADFKECFGFEHVTVRS